MIFSEILGALPSLTPDERQTIHDALYAFDHNMSVEEWRALDAALQEELNDPSPTVPAEEVFARLNAKYKPGAT